MNHCYEVLTEDGFQPFLTISTKVVDEFLEVFLKDGSSVKCTLSHRFKVGNEFIEANDLTTGMLLSPNDVEVEGIIHYHSEIEVFDLVDVEGGNNYLTNGVTSHNCEFLSSDLTLFDSYIISTQETEYDRRVDRITMNDRNKGLPDYEPSYPFRIGTNHFWKRIEKDKTYIVGVDPATGSGEDYTVFQVFEFPSLFQVMEFRSNTMSPAVAYTQLKQLLLFLEQYTKDIYFSIESNGVGAAMLALYEADDTLPRWAHLVSDKGARKTGMTTTHFTKTLAALKFKELFERNNMILNSKTLFHEMKNYVRREGSYAANIGVNDDCIAAVLIVIRILEDIATYDDAAYVRMYNVEAQIEMEGKWDYDKNDIDRLRQPARHDDEDESEEPMPFLI